MVDLWERNSSSLSYYPKDGCECDCHRVHKKEVEQSISQEIEDKNFILQEKGRKDKELFTKQYAECSRPFRDFLEKSSSDYNRDLNETN